MDITHAESAIMEVLWRHEQPLTAEDIIAALAGTHDWQATTIKTLISRLLAKRAIAATKDGRRYFYRPRLARDKYLLTESAGVIDRLFDGRVAPLVAHFSQHGRLSKQDLDELKRLIQELDDGAVE